ncbi:MAG: molybdopterin cofactor-binding domain-containing protein [Bacteroidota bacterium]
MISVKLNINSEEYEVLINEDEMLSYTLRERLFLKGTKVGCDQGSCGACTVLIDDEPVLSCITPTLKASGKFVTTIEGIHKDDDIYLQELFVKHGAIQCGFCTPGMIMTVKSLINKNSQCSVDEIKEAISGNLCRCTGYKKIIDAIAEYSNTFREKHKSILSNDSDFNIIGKSTPYIEAHKKVTGTADYADDYIFKNTLHCKFLRSPYPHAIIKSIDISEALKLKGVKYIATGKELPEKFGVLPISQDETCMAIDKVRYVGEIVAAVAAISDEICNKALKLIKVEYEPLETFLNIDDSLKSTNCFIHSHSEKYRCNIHKTAEIRIGDNEKSYQKCDVIKSMEVTFEGINHGFTEPHVCTAWVNENGINIITATQVPHYLHRSISKVLHVPLHKVRVIKPYVGGGFGGKSDPFPHEIIACYLAMKTGQPVRVKLTREEVFLTNHGRHPSKIRITIGANKSGYIKYIDGNMLIDGGAYGSFGVVTTYYNGSLLQGPYQTDYYGYKSIRVYTNKPQCGAMRGHGGVNPRFVVECVVDEIAHELKIDPIDFRLKNLLPPNTTTIGQFRITSNGLKEALLNIMNQSGWKQKYGHLPYGHGIGVACSWYISGSLLPIIWNEYPQSVVHLKLDFDGRILLTSGASDIGQGTDTILPMIVAEILGIDKDYIQCVMADTLLTPVDLGSYSSRVTFMAGNAAKAAAEKLKNEILKTIAVKKELNENELVITNSSILHKETRKEICNWQQAVDIVLSNRGAISVSGWYISPKLGGTYKGAGAGLSPSYSFGAVIAEVKVNPDTGEYKVLNLWGAHDCGKAINPLAVEGQLEGSWHMGLGQALSEQMKYHNGHLLTNNFLEYKIPTSLDTPEIFTNIIESKDPEGPFGAKECGEGALHPSIPAVANAIYNAVGIRVTSLPITFEKVLQSLQQKQIKVSL